MKKKHIAVITACIMIVLLILPAGTALAASDVSAHMEATVKNMALMDKDGKLLTPDGGGNYSNVPKDAQIKIEYRFNLLDDNKLDPSDPLYEEYNYVAGDYIDVQLPYAVSFSAPTGGWNVYAVGTTDVMGTLSINSGGLARITFTDYVATHSSIQAWFELEGSFKEEIFDVGDPVAVTVEFAGIMTNIHFEWDPVSISAEKIGFYNSLTNTILWTFSVTSDRTLSAVTLVDTFSKNQTFASGSFYMDTPAADPVNIPDSQLIIDTSGTSATITFTCGLQAGETTFFYKTTPTATAFAAETGTNKNVAFLNSIDVNFEGENKAHDDANVTIDWIQKTGAVAGTSATDSRIINWTVTANSNGYSLSNAVITDTIPAGLELFVDATHPIRLAGVDISASATHDPGTFTYEAGTGGAHILTVYAGSISASRVLTFSTQVTDDTVYQHNGTTPFTNSVQLGWDANAFGTPTDTSTVNVGIGVLSKAAGSRVNYNYGTTSVMNWTVRVNQNCVPIMGAVFTDTIDPSLSGMEYVAGSFKIDGVSVMPIYIPATGALSYIFGNITTPYTITFQTRITDITKLHSNSTVSFNNSVELQYSSGLTGTITATGTQQYNSQMLAKSVAVGYNHITRRVTWQLVVNRNQLPLPANTLITETIPAGMTLIPETFDIVGETGESLSVYTVNPLSDLTHNDSFTYALPESSTSTYTIQFQTQVKEGMLLTQGAKSFTNSARLTGTSLDLTATANVSFNNSMVTKTLSHLTGADYISWAVFMNREAVALDGIEASDTLQAGLAIDLDSVALYPMTLDAGGNLTKGSTPVPKSQYTVTYNSTTRVLKFTMPGVHTQPYELDFITDVVTSPLTVNNTVTMKGESYTATGQITETVVQVSESGLGGTGLQGSITVEKTDEHDKPLSGAVFTLYDNRGAEVKHAATDKDGRVVFGSLPIRTYILEETTPPPGYLKNAAPVRIRMGTDTPNVFYKFEDDLIHGSIKIVKTNIGGTPLAGAVYGLYKADDTDFSDPVALGTSAVDGSILFEDIPYGDYVIREVSAPVGYTVSPQAVAVAVRENGALVITTPTAVQDESIKGSIRMLKYRTDMKTPIAGAKFGLYVPTDTKFLNPVVTATSGADGVVLFQNITYGDYVIREISAPKGYSISRKTIAVQIRKDGETVDAGTFTDRKKPPEDSPKTGDDILIYGVIFAASAIGLGVIALLGRSRKAKRERSR